MTLVFGAALAAPPALADDDAPPTYAFSYEVSVEDVVGFVDDDSGPVDQGGEADPGDTLLLVEQSGLSLDEPDVTE